MAKSKKDVEGGLGIHARRAIAYIVLIIISFFCLFWFYIMFINATRSKGELKAGFTALPSDHLLTNWNNLVHGTLPIWSGMFNSLIIAAATAVLCVYFSTMTAYAIHAYDFKLKKFIYPFILMNSLRYLFRMHRTTKKRSVCSGTMLEWRFTSMNIHVHGFRN